MKHFFAAAFVFFGMLFMSGTIQAEVNDGPGFARYSENFAFDPNYLQYNSSNAGNCEVKWTGDSYYAKVFDQNSDWWCLGHSPAFTPFSTNEDFVVAFDFNPVKMDWGHYPGIYFHDLPITNKADLHTNDYNGTMFRFVISYADNSYKKLRFVFSGASGGQAKSYLTNTVPAENEWYRVTIVYHSATSTADLKILRQDGSDFYEKNGVDAPVSGTFNYLSIGEVGSGPAYGDMSEIMADNIVITTNTNLSSNKISLLTKTSPNYTIAADSDNLLYGTSSHSQVIVEKGARAELINFPGQNNIQFQSSTDLFTVSRSGTVVTFQGSDGTVLKIPATTDIQTVSFSDRNLTLSIHANQIMLDDQAIGSLPAAIKKNDFLMTEIWDMFINGDKYTVTGELIPPVTDMLQVDLFSDPATWVQSVNVLKNDTQGKLTEDEYRILSKGIIRLYQPFISSINTEWDDDFGMYLPSCGSFFGYFTFDWPSTACLTTKEAGFNGLFTIGDDTPERIKNYKSVIKDMISGISNAAGRGIVSLDDGMGNSINADALPSSFSALEQFVDASEKASKTLGIVNALISLVKGGMESDSVIKIMGLKGKEAEFFKNNFTWLQSFLVLQQTGLSFSSKVAINQILANFGQLLEYTNTLKISYEYVKTKVNPLIDPAMLTAIEELEEEILDSSNIVMNTLKPAIEAGYDNAESILSSVINLTKFSDKFADLFVVKTNSVVQSSSDKLLAKQASVAAGSIISAAANTIFMVRDKSDTWEEIFIATHLHEVLSEYHFDNPKFRETVVRNENFVKIDPETADHLLVLFNLIDASALNFYDKFISLIDTNWTSVIMETASDVLAGATTGTLLTPLPWFGSAVTWGSAVGEQMSCAAAKDQCEQLHDEAGKFRKATVNRHKVLNQWALLLKDS